MLTRRVKMRRFLPELGLFFGRHITHCAAFFK
jgi:hypothetical protein